MSRSNEHNMSFGGQGLFIENEQDPASANPSSLTNAPDGALKNALNVDYQGTANLHRRKGYQDNMHRPENKTVELTLVALVNEPTAGSIITETTTGATMRVLSSDAGANTIRGISTNAFLFVAGNQITNAGGTLNPTPATIAALGVNYVVDTYDVHDVFQVATGEFADSEHTWTESRTETYGIRGLSRYTYLDNRSVKSTAGYDLERYTIFAMRDEDYRRITWHHNMTTAPLDGAILTQDNTGAQMIVIGSDLGADQVWGYVQGTFNDVDDVHDSSATMVPDPNDPHAITNESIGLSHTYHWRNPATPNMKRLEYPLLDRDTTPGKYGFPISFSDDNTFGNEANRFYNYCMWTRGGERETYLLGTNGGHYRPPEAAGPPPAWTCGVGTSSPPAGTFDSPFISPYAIQRRVKIWFPTWYEWWAGIQGFTAAQTIPEVGLHNWFAPFIWYFDQKHFGASDFYAEPCGRFIKRYNNSLFMARLERSYLIPGAGSGDDDTVGWTYEPSGYMWSFYGLATGMELGTPPVYPFAIPNEPAERVWGCYANGYQLNRHNYFRPADGVPVVGLETWNDRLYIMKPTGFGEIYGTYSTNFALTDLQMSQGPAGAFAWCKADEGIYYITKKGLYLFDGNGASQNICLSDGRGGSSNVKKIFEEDIDWRSCTDMLTGEITGVIMAWDKQTRSVLISYPKRGEQGVGTGTHTGFDLPAGTPTRMMVFDTQYKRFTEWILPLPIEINYRHPAPGIMLGGQDPTDDDYMMITHPIGDATPMVIVCNFPGSVMTVLPTIGSTITQAATGATMVVTAVNLANSWVIGTDQHTGVWDTVTPIGTISDGAGPMIPDPCTPAVISMNNNGRLLFHANTGYRDNVTLDGSAVAEPLSGDRITYDATSKDNTLGELKPKLTVMQQRQIIYANNGGIKRKVIYNYYDVLDEEELTFGATADGYYSEKQLIHQVVHTGTDSVLAVVAMKYYHDDPDHTALRITFNTGGNPMTATPPIGAVLTQAVTGATLLVTSVNLGTLQVWGQDLGTGVWDTTAGHVVTSVPVGLLPVTVVPSALATVLNPDNTNPDLEPIQWIAVSLETVHMAGQTKSSQ